MQGKKILVIDDDTDLLQLVKTILANRGCTVLTASSGREGLQEFFASQPDLVICDLMMPEMDGWQVCDVLSRTSRVPIILLTALSGEGSEVRGLESYAVDYIVKPFSAKVLVARIQAAFRRLSPAKGSREPGVYHGSYLLIDLENRRVLAGGQAVKLTPTEYRLLGYLFQNAGRVLTHQQILDAIWGWEYQDSVHYVHVHISRLRRKLEPDPQRPRYLLTEHGVGYRFELPPE
ncbi:MAG: response regulator transcription factor [candidate division KSB1 bacterium]|nr:response regulator transcription factor [candidate division KSB1 bacterium]